MVVLWGSNARDAHPIFFHHVLKAVHRGAKLFVVDPRRTSTAQWADHWLGLDVGTDIALANTVARRDHPRRPGPRALRRAGDHRLRRARRLRRAVDARARRAGDRRPGRGHPRAGPRLRLGRPGPAVLDARHHRAPQRRRQRAGPHQPGAADRPRRALRLGAQPPPRPEQRAGRGRHGRHPQPAARLPGHPRRRRCASVRAGLGLHPPGQVRLAPVRHVRGHGSRRPPGALRAGREPGPERGRRRPRPPPAGRPRPPRGAGHLPDQDRRDGRRGAAGVRGLVRERRHRHQQRAPGAAGPQGPRSAGRRPRRHLDPPGDRPPARATTGTTTAPKGIWDEVRALSPMHRGMSYARLEELGGIQWPCYHDDRLEPSYLHGRLWADDPAERGRSRP